MPRFLNYWSRRTLVVGGVVSLGLVSLPLNSSAAPQDQLATGRLHVVTFNVCDQYQRDHPDPACYTHTPSQRAPNVAVHLNNWSAQAGMLQEMCRSTYNKVKDQYLTGSWYGYFDETVTLGDNRCQDSSHEWGLAVMGKGSIPSPATSSSYSLPTTDEPRKMVCANFTLYSGLRICSTHFSVPGTQSQVDTVANNLNARILDGAAVMLGADLNININSTCTEANKLKPLYVFTDDFGHGTGYCGPGQKYMYEADNENPGGDGTFDENTVDASGKKYDYIFMNYQRFYNTAGNIYGADASASAYSDHDPLLGAMTIHD